MYRAEFRFLKSNQSNQIFLAHYSPVGETVGGKEKKSVILVSPFGEEMNRSKRMYVLTARELANSGLHAFCFDFAGTGDSFGEWGDYGWHDWRKNLFDVFRHVRDLGIKNVSVIALRLAALLVAEAIASQELQVDKCIFWDPVEKGEMFTRHLVRMKIAATMAEQSKKLSTREIVDKLEKDGFLEVGGYRINASLFADIDTKNLSNSMENVSSSSDVYWMLLSKIAANGKMPPRPSSITENLEDKINLATIADTRFWMQQEVTVSPLLIQKTKDLFVDAT